MRWMLSVALCVACLGTGFADENWNQFRGPRGDGSSLSTNLPVKFAEGSPEVTWKIPLPGRAWSSPVIWGEQIWLTNGPEVQNLPEGKAKLDTPLKLSAVCVDAKTGKVLHDRVLFEVEKPQFTHATNSYASCTPYVEEGRVYIHFGAYGTACLDTATAKTIWERTDIPCDHFRGPGSSVAIYGDLLYITMDGFDVQYIMALNKHTGETVWRTDRNVDFGTTDGDAKKAYSTPLLIQVEGRDLLVSPFASHTIAYEPLTGKPLWSVKHGGMNAAGRPLFGNGLVYVTTADGPNPLVAIKPNGSGDLTENIEWKSNKSIPKRPSLILFDDLLFMMNDGGVASCLEAMTGKVIWSKRLTGEYWASPIIANGLIYCLSQSGDVIVFKATRTLEIVAENKLAEGFNASPAVVGDALILRSLTHLYRIEKPSSARAAAK